MNPQFIAKPPQPVKWGSITKHLGQMFRRIGYIIWQIVVPFNSRPEEIKPFPEPDPTFPVNESHVEQCQWIFDQAEERRVNLEQKAQSTFGLMVFLVPLLASLFVFIIGRGTTSSTLIVTLVLVGVSAVFLLLGFISAIRAVAVKESETLFLDSVLTEGGQFRKYSEAFRARGFLFCASMNTATNDHIAQFVKGAHILTAAAVLVLLLAAVPTSVVFLRLPPSPAETKIVGSVNISAPELSALRDDIANLKNDIQKLSNSKVSEDGFALLEEKVAKLDAKLSELQKARQAGATKTVKPGQVRGSPNR
jgi:hypothetical protein